MVFPECFVSGVHVPFVLRPTVTASSCRNWNRQECNGSNRLLSHRRLNTNVKTFHAANVAIWALTKETISDEDNPLIKRLLEQSAANKEMRMQQLEKSWNDRGFDDYFKFSAKNDPVFEIQLLAGFLMPLVILALIALAQSRTQIFKSKNKEDKGE
mmetsp:Transcript_10755/g.18227  ORF Transcript_10755/g.18227 Transcript_10755/m.18227 type:complete len:156 (-) Transcript_10755:204-671(-)